MKTQTKIKLVLLLLVMLISVVSVFGDECDQSYLSHEGLPDPDEIKVCSASDIKSGDFCKDYNGYLYKVIDTVPMTWYNAKITNSNDVCYLSGFGESFSERTDPSTDWTGGGKGSTFQDYEHLYDNIITNVSCGFNADTFPDALLISESDISSTDDKREELTSSCFIRDDEDKKYKLYYPGSDGFIEYSADCCPNGESYECAPTNKNLRGIKQKYNVYVPEQKYSHACIQENLDEVSCSHTNTVPEYLFVYYEEASKDWPAMYFKKQGSGFHVYVYVNNEGNEYYDKIDTIGCCDIKNETAYVCSLPESDSIIIDAFSEEQVITQGHSPSIEQISGMVDSSRGSPQGSGTKEKLTPGTSYPQQGCDSDQGCQEIDEVWKVLFPGMSIEYTEDDTQFWKPESSTSGMMVSWETLYLPVTTSGGYGSATNADGSINIDAFAQAINALDTVDEHSALCCGDWVAKVYKWLGYAYVYKRDTGKKTMRQIADTYGVPIAFDVQRDIAKQNAGQAGSHIYFLLGIGPSADTWLTKLSNVQKLGSFTSVGENQALVVGYTGTSRGNVVLEVLDLDYYSTDEIQGVKLWSYPLCGGTYVRDNIWYIAGENNGEMDYGNGNRGFSYYNWEPTGSSPYYPYGGACNDVSIASNYGSTSYSGLVKGIDVYNAHGDIDWGEVYNSGYRFTFIKVTEGTSLTDAKYLKNLNGAKSNGLLTGCYHFALPSLPISKDAEAEADYFLEKAEECLKSDNLLPVLDLETGNDKLSSNQLSEWVTVWMGVVENKIGKKPIIYGGKYVRDHFDDRVINKYPLWYAWWIDNPDSPDGEPYLGNDWNNWVFWQTGGKKINAIPGNEAHLDFFQGNEEELKKYLIGYEDNKNGNLG